jgi:ketosteroid isomerase-like protein
VSTRRGNLVRAFSEILQAMSQENVEVIKAVLAAFNRGDWDAALSYAAPEFQMDTSRDSNEWRGVYATPKSVKRAMEGFFGLWESWRIEIDEFVQISEDVIVTRQTGCFRGRDGIEVTTHTNWVWALQDGAVSEFASYHELDEALEAAELSE